MRGDVRDSFYHFPAWAGRAASLPLPHIAIKQRSLRLGAVVNSLQVVTVSCSVLLECCKLAIGSPGDNTMVTVIIDHGSLTDPASFFGKERLGALSRAGSEHTGLPTLLGALCRLVLVQSCSVLAEISLVGEDCYSSLRLMVRSGPVQHTVGARTAAGRSTTAQWVGVTHLLLHSHVTC